MNRPEPDSLFDITEPLPPARSRQSGRRRSAPDTPIKPLGPQENWPVWQPLPRWTRCGEIVSTDETAFAAGAALFALDQIVKNDFVWLGAFRLRQALTAAAAAGPLLRRCETEAELRDAHHLPSDDPGPAGRLHRAWRTFATRPSRLDKASLDRLVEGLGLDPIAAMDLLDRIEATKGSPVVAAAVAARLAAEVASGRDGEVLGLMLADMVLAIRLGWAVPVPLLATAMLGLKTGSDGRRPRPDNPGWNTACHAAYVRASAAAHARAFDIARRAERLIAAAGKVRTKSGGAGILALLGDDAIAATALKKLGSERAARRFLARLVELGGIRELTGRDTFRLYGL